MTAQFSKIEILERIRTETSYLDCLQKDYREKFTQMTSEQHIRRQSNINQSMRTLAALQNELAEFYAETQEVGEMVERLIFETNKSLVL